MRGWVNKAAKIALEFLISNVGLHIVFYFFESGCLSFVPVLKSITLKIKNQTQRGGTNRSWFVDFLNLRVCKFVPPPGSIRCKIKSWTSSGGTNKPASNFLKKLLNQIALNINISKPPIFTAPWKTLYAQLQECFYTCSQFLPQVTHKNRDTRS